MSIWQRLLAAIGRVLSAFFNIRIKLKYVLVLVILLVAGCIGVTYNRMINAVGGKADYDEAMRYIEMKDLVDEYFIDPADRKEQYCHLVLISFFLVSREGIEPSPPSGS